MTYRMPQLADKAENLSKEAKNLVSLICDREGKLLKTRPRKTGISDYVWRNVAFQISPLPIHHHLPMGAPFYLPGPKALGYEKWMELQKALNVLVDEICDTIPVQDWQGIAQWSLLIA